MASDPVKTAEQSMGEDFSSICVPTNCHAIASSTGAHPMELLLLLIGQRERDTRDQIVEKSGKFFLDTDNSINAAVRKIRRC